MRGPCTCAARPRTKMCSALVRGRPHPAEEPSYERERIRMACPRTDTSASVRPVLVRTRAHLYGPSSNKVAPCPRTTKPVARARPRTDAGDSARARPPGVVRKCRRRKSTSAKPSSTGAGGSGRPPRRGAPGAGSIPLCGTPNVNSIGALGVIRGRRATSAPRAWAGSRDAASSPRRVPLGPGRTPWEVKPRVRCRARFAPIEVASERRVSNEHNETRSAELDRDGLERARLERKSSRGRQRDHSAGLELGLFCGRTA